MTVRMNVYNFFNFRGVTTTARWKTSAEEHRMILTLLTQREGKKLGALLESHLTGAWVVARKIVLGQVRLNESTTSSHFNSLFREAKG